MKLVLDEDIPRQLVRRFEEAGHTAEGHGRGDTGVADCGAARHRCGRKTGDQLTLPPGSSA